MKPIFEVINGDCLEVMKMFSDNQFDLVLTDPPFGVKRDKGFGGTQAFGGGIGRQIARIDYPDSWDDERISKDYFDEILRISQNAIIFGGNFYTDYLPVGGHWIFWDKLNTMPSFGDGELAWTNVDRKAVSKITVQWNGLLGKESDRWHPTQKPVKLLQEIVKRYSKERDTVLDCFSGSFSAGVACMIEKRNFVGIELSKEYCEIGEARMRRALLEPVGHS